MGQADAKKADQLMAADQATLPLDPLPDILIWKKNVIGPVTDEIVTTQQAVADRFHKLGLIPRQIAVRDIVWRPVQT